MGAPKKPKVPAQAPQVVLVRFSSRYGHCFGPEMADFQAFLGHLGGCGGGGGGEAKNAFLGIPKIRCQLLEPCVLTPFEPYFGPKKDHFHAFFRTFWGAKTGHCSLTWAKKNTPLGSSMRKQSLFFLAKLRFQPLLDYVLVPRMPIFWSQNGPSFRPFQIFWGSQRAENGPEPLVGASQVAWGKLRKQPVWTTF